MYQPKFPSHADPRRGVILMVVLAMLTMFAIVGISFVFYASAAGQNAQIARDAESNNKKTDLNPNMLLSYFLGQLIYDADDFSGAYSALRGHSLARLMYGINYTTNPTAPLTPMYNDSNGIPLNNVPFNGLGRVHTTLNHPNGVDDYYWINYTYYSADGFVRDPERLGFRASPIDTTKATTYAGGFNVPYTYPDLNNMFLAAVKADGTVLVPSFHRNYATGFGPLGQLVNNQFVPNPNWFIPDSIDPSLKHKVLRPRPIDQLKQGETWPPNRPYFPAPEDAGGDVKNLVGAPGGNDSIWIDLGFPVITTADGKKYKPLFAPLIIDLDNRVNLNVHGNMNGSTGGHISHEGWGPWEVNLEKVLIGRESTPPNDLEWKQLFKGRMGTSNPYVYGRYGRPFQGGNGSKLPPIPGQLPGQTLPGQSSQPRFSSLFDFDSNAAMAPLDSSKLPAYFYLPDISQTSPVKPYSSFPLYNDMRLAQLANNNYVTLDQQVERKGHPAMYNFFQPNYTLVNGLPLPGRAFSISNMDPILRFGDSGTEALQGDLMRLLSQNFTANINSARFRGMVTTHSFDVDRPGVFPAWYNAGGAGYQLLFPNTGFPTGAAPSLPTVFTGTPGGPSGEFGPDYRSALAALGRVDLGRTLTPYPDANANGQIPANAQLQQALQDRQQFAFDIFQRLCAATMGVDPSNATTMGQVKSNPAAFDAARWLAQLAANIVDYIDEDDYMTAFNWYTYTDPITMQPTPYYVYGTELPRVVLNEAYVEFDNDPNELNPQGGRATQPLRYNFWVELHNTFRPDPSRTPPDNGPARLMVGANPGTPAYQILIGLPDGTFRKNDNPTGAPQNVKTRVSTFNNSIINSAYDANGVIQYSSPNPPGNQGFYVLGPQGVNFLASQQATATVPTEAVVSNLTATPPVGLTYQQDFDAQGNIPVPNLLHTIYLQRLACPGLPYDPNTNPYITVDYVENVQTSDMVKFTKSGIRNPPPDPTLAGSWGKMQPYASQQVQQQKKAGQTSEPKHTFFSHNDDQANPTGTLTQPFDWLMHYDRQVVSPADLLNVSMYRPFELTQQFIVGQVALGQRPNPTQKFMHRARQAFVDPGSRLWRGLEYMTTRNRAAGVGSGARIPGKININTVWDPEILMALVDPQLANSAYLNQPGFVYNPQNPADPTTMWANLVSQRSPGLYQSTPNILEADRPFRGFAPSPAIGGGLFDTLLRSMTPQTPTTGPLLLELQNTPHPAYSGELLSKIYNQITTRSNVFAVWTTVGFFEVVDDSTQPVKLGAEVGKSEGKNIRHRFFAIVDRSGLTTSSQNAAGLPPVFTKTLGPVTLVNNQATTVQVQIDAQFAFDTQTNTPYLYGTYEDVPWTIKGSNPPPPDATVLWVGTGADKEPVVVTGVAIGNPTGTPPTAPTFTATFSKPHPEGTPIQVISRQLAGSPAAQSVVESHGVLGNPGVVPNLDATTIPWIVKYATIIN